MTEPAAALTRRPSLCAASSFVLGAALMLLALPHSTGAAGEALSVTDARDGAVYPIVEIGGTAWLARNLNFAAVGSYCYADDAAHCDTMGRLYPWEIAVTACPAGWHLSTEYEWRALETALGMPAVLLDGLEERGVQGDALKVGGGSGFDIPFAGWRDPNGEWRNLGESTALWVDDELDIHIAQHRDLDIDRRGIWRSAVDKPYALSVRCVRHHYLPVMVEWEE